MQASSASRAASSPSSAIRTSSLTAGRAPPARSRPGRGGPRPARSPPRRSSSATAGGLAGADLERERCRRRTWGTTSRIAVEAVGAAPAAPRAAPSRGSRVPAPSSSTVATRRAGWRPRDRTRSPRAPSRLRTRPARASPSRRAFSLGQLERRRGGVGRGDRAPRQLVGDRQRDRAAAGADVEHGPRTQLERDLDQQLGLRTGDQRPAGRRPARSGGSPCGRGCRRPARGAGGGARISPNARAAQGGTAASGSAARRARSQPMSPRRAAARRRGAVSRPRRRAARRPPRASASADRCPLWQCRRHASAGACGLRLQPHPLLLRREGVGELAEGRRRARRRGRARCA